MSLAAMQRDFAGWLTDRPGSMAAWVDGAAQAGLDVYHNAYHMRLADCLHEMFEKTALWLGDEAFMTAARAHIDGRPPHGWTLGVYGDGFDRTLARLYPDDREVEELTWLDHALTRTFEGRDADPVSAERLAGVDWDEASLIFVPTLSIGPAITNAGAIWSALAAQEQPPAAAMLPEAGAMLVWRQGFTPCFRAIGTVEADMLADAVAGASFSALCASLIDRLGEEAGVRAAGALLGQWIGEGLITDIFHASSIRIAPPFMP
ncbi:DNA-binding domain-containing protein [Sphingobium sp.]|uniref:DNA-binding domain-containing protein n=1 Tax=Sphingobium sp. TaxID=1912891 RepID=UPI001A1F756E|nr:DNA-binding domain-containing protein [Sphingobium sp.]MBJ7376072.1 putative DNA-binding domain-containing protein [Sphingobium sp.]